MGDHISPNSPINSAYFVVSQEEAGILLNGRFLRQIFLMGEVSPQINIYYSPITTTSLRVKSARSPTKNS